MSEPKLLSSEAHQQQWVALSFGERRQITKRINKGVVAESRQEALLAVPIARRQTTFWKFAWLLGPVGALFALDQGVNAFLINAIFSTMVLGGISLWFSIRMRRSMDLNLALLATSGSSSKKRKRSSAELLDDAAKPPTPKRKGPDPTARLADWSDDGPSKNTSKAKSRRRKR